MCNIQHLSISKTISLKSVFKPTQTDGGVIIIIIFFFLKKKTLFNQNDATLFHTNECHFATLYIHHS
jgi:hypothetical protein